MANANIEVQIIVTSKINYQGFITQESNGKFYAAGKLFGPFETFNDAAKHINDFVGLDLIVEQTNNKQGTDPTVFVTVEDPRKFNFYIDGQIETRDFDIVRVWDEETEEPEYRAVHYSRVGWWQPAGPTEEEPQTVSEWENMRRRVEASEQAKYGVESATLRNLRDDSEYVGRWTEAAGEPVGNSGGSPGAGKDDEYEKYIRHDARNHIYYIDGLDKLMNGAKGYHTKDEALEDIKGFIEGCEEREALDRYYEGFIKKDHDSDNYYIVGLDVSTGKVLPYRTREQALAEVKELLDNRVNDYKSTAAQLIRDGSRWAMSRMWHGATISDFAEQLAVYADGLEFENPTN